MSSDELNSSIKIRENSKKVIKALFTSLISIFVVVLQVVFLARLLGAEQRGLMVLLLTISNLSGVVFSFGYGISKSKEEFKGLILNQIITINLLTAFFAGIVCLILLTLRNSEHKFLFTFFVIASSFASSGIFLLNDILITSRNFLQIKYIYLLCLCLELLTYLLLNQLYALSINHILLINCFFTYITYGLFLLRYKSSFKLESKLTSKQLTSTWKLLIPLIASVQFINFYRIPLSIVLNYKEIATLTISFSYVLLGSPIIGYAAQILRSNAALGKTFCVESKKTFRFSMLVLTVLASLQFITAKDFVIFTLGDEYLNCVNEIKILSATGPLIAIFVFTLEILNGKGLKSSYIFSSFSLLGTFLLILTAGSFLGTLGLGYLLLGYILFLSLFSVFYLYRLQKRF